MERNINIEEISDGKKYHANDLVKIGCNDCKGCYSCCVGMKGLITLDPYDIYRMLSNPMWNGEDFNSLLNKYIELTVDRGLLIPTLMMDEERGECLLLREDKRCSIHDYRSGVCRLFPLGRLYEEGSFYYFLQKDECSYKEKTKVKIKNWMSTPEFSKYEQYISDWHYFTREIQDYFASAGEEEVKQINMVLLKIFYMTGYETDFYEEFYARLKKVKDLL